MGYTAVKNGLSQCFPDERQMVVDVMAGRYLDKLYTVGISLGIGAAGGKGHDLILCAVNDGDGGHPDSLPLAYLLPVCFLTGQSMLTK